MDFRILSTALDGIVVIEPTVVRDRRGFFLESWQVSRYAACGIPAAFVQDNVSRSERGTLRGLHAQEPFGQGKLVQVLEGEVFDVAVDIRLGSPTFGQHVSECISAENHRQIYIPPGFAHGFCVVSESALFAYKCTELYHPEAELRVAWNDPDLAIRWPVDDPTLSALDAVAPKLADIPLDRLPR